MVPKLLPALAAASSSRRGCMMEATTATTQEQGMCCMPGFKGLGVQACQPLAACSHHHPGRSSSSSSRIGVRRAAVSSSRSQARWTGRL